MASEELPAAVWADAGSLAPWEQNPRDNAGAVEDLARSILRFGFGAPIVARSEGREVIAGHTRLLAVAFLGAHVLDHDSGRFRARREADGPFLVPGAPSPGAVPVRFVDLPLGEARALALADNKLGEIADWSDGLDDVLRELQAQDVPLDGLGWSDDALDALIKGGAPPDPPTGFAHTGDPVYAVIVEYATEAEQEAAFGRLSAEVVNGYPNIRVVVA